MKRLVEIFGRVLLFACFALACTLAFCGVVLFTLEKSGWLADLVRGRVRAELTASGTEFDIEDVELDWFTPGLTLHGLALGVDGGLARINRATLILSAFAPAARRVKHVRIDGGRVRLSTELFDALASLGRGAGEPPQAPAPQILADVAAFPPIEIHGVQFDVGDPRLGDIPLGSVDAVFLHAADGRAELRGVLAPSLADSGNLEAAIYMQGRVERAGILSLHLSTAGFPFRQPRCRQVPRSRACEIWTRQERSGSIVVRNFRSTPRHTRASRFARDSSMAR